MVIACKLYLHCTFNGLVIYNAQERWQQSTVIPSADTFSSRIKIVCTCETWAYASGKVVLFLWNLRFAVVLCLCLVQSSLPDIRNVISKVYLDEYSTDSLKTSILMHFKLLQLPVQFNWMRLIPYTYVLRKYTFCFYVTTGIASNIINNINKYLLEMTNKCFHFFTIMLQVLNIELYVFSRITDTSMYCLSVHVIIIEAIRSYKYCQYIDFCHSVWKILHNGEFLSDDAAVVNAKLICECPLIITF